MTFDKSAIEALILKVVRSKEIRYADDRIEDECVDALAAAVARVHELERTDDITMTAFGKLRRMFKEQVLRAEAAECNQDERAAWCANWLIEKHGGTKDLPAWVAASARYYRELSVKLDAAERQLAECKADAERTRHSGRWWGMTTSIMPPDVAEALRLADLTAMRLAEQGIPTGELYRSVAYSNYAKQRAALAAHLMHMRETIRREALEEAKKACEKIEDEELDLHGNTQAANGAERCTNRISALAAKDEHGN